MAAAQILQPAVHRGLEEGLIAGSPGCGVGDDVLRRLGERDVPELALVVPVEVRDLQKLFERAKDLTNHAEFVVVGSNCVLGVPRDRELPRRMTMSNDVDAYTRNDPGRIFDLEAELGQGSPFELENGYYLDPISPSLPTLPDGWESRLFHVKFDSGLVLYFLDPNDAAVSKYARSEPRDREWLQAGLAAGILSAAVIEYRMRETRFADGDERARAVAAFEKDRARRRPAH
jgi:hypothetical protein